MGDSIITETDKSKSRKLVIDGTAFEIRDNRIPVQYVDLFTENRVLNGTINLSLGAIVVDGQNDPTIDIACRLRMNVVTAQNLHAALGSLIADALKPANKSQAN